MHVQNLLRFEKKECTILYMSIMPIQCRCKAVVLNVPYTNTSVLIRHNLLFIRHSNLQPLNETHIIPVNHWQRARLICELPILFAYDPLISKQGVLDLLKPSNWQPVGLCYQDKGRSHISLSSICFQCERPRQSGPSTLLPLFRNDINSPKYNNYHNQKTYCLN